ncbi:unnamed protein product [Schistosoma margrebowiei]|uniref:Uncharacterized protein n=1 Tax=Schistosoma margrebowiei TaxID=48269 RepID=A0A3P7YHA1_9TREM|nr:unnamed protein product [Schistosoma margrebowiei]
MDSSAGCICISELIFTLGLELITFRFKHHRVIHLATESL